VTGANAEAEQTEPTGERFESGLPGGHIVEAEQLARYAWAAQFAEGKRVLDAACGRGHGAGILAAAGAAEVVGIDSDEQAISEARRQQIAGATFEVGDVCDLSCESAAFDLVVSFETLEHARHPARALDEFRRVLDPKGIVALSTPNGHVYTPGNALHLRELSPDELQEELAARFSSVAMRRQQSWAQNQPGLATYQLALAGNAELPVGRGLFSLGRAHAETEAMRRELSALRRELARCESDLEEFTEIGARLTSAEAALREYELVLASTSWRITRPLRNLAGWLRRRRP
jgi:2-polyprenyl-3-methyl-5-hydroxy-6-metoxy-1,4-benzoquinol methylase